MDGKTVLSNKDLFSNSSGVVSGRGIFSDLVTKNINSDYWKGVARLPVAYEFNTVPSCSKGG